MTIPSFDYAEIQEVSQTLIEEFGRQITFVQLKSTPDDGAKPWLGSSTPRTNPVATLTVFGTFAEPESLERLSKQSVSGDFVKSAEQVLIVSTLENLLKFDEVIDSADGSSYKIYNIQELSPGKVNVLQYVRVQRRGKVTAVRGALL